MRRIGNSLAVYFERRMARILLLGIISGFPWVLIGSSLSLWLKEDGFSRSTIGWAGLIFGVYAFNFLWAPLIDRIQLPWLSVRLGHRRVYHGCRSRGKDDRGGIGRSARPIRYRADTVRP